MIDRDHHRMPLAIALLAAAWIACGPAAAGVFRARPYPSWEGERTSQTLNLFTYYEEDAGLKVFAGTEMSRFHDDATFFPLQVAVGNSQGVPVTITREEFLLTDDQGIYYPLARHEDIASEYSKSAFDQTLRERSQFLGDKFVAFQQVPSLFFPNITFRGVRNDRVQLPKGTYLQDVLYFRKPEGSLHGKTFTLTVYFPQQERQIDVKFEVPGKEKGTD